MRKVILLFLLVSFLVYLPPSWADYYLPPAQERFMVLASKWQIKDGMLMLKLNGKQRQWKIEPFWLADRVDSDSICTGGYQSKMTAYLAKLGHLSGESPLLVELVAVRKGETLFVAGLWQYENLKSYENARQYGSAILGMSPQQIEKLGSRAAYEKNLNETFQENWQLVDQHK
jgi:hypothetical protein